LAADFVFKQTDERFYSNCFPYLNKSIVDELQIFAPLTGHLKTCYISGEVSGLLSWMK